VSEARAAFVDRDGVINELVPDPESGLPESPLHVEDVALVAGAAAALVSLAAAGWRLAGISNQPAAAKGNVSVDQLLAVQSRVLALLNEQGVHLDDFRLCLHHPQGTVPGLTTACGCRKPAPGMLLEAGRALAVDLARSLGGLVDPCSSRELGRRWRVADEPLGVPLVGGVEHSSVLLVHRRRGAVVDGRRGHQPGPGVAMRVVVAVDERAVVGAGARAIVKSCGLGIEESGGDPLVCRGFVVSDLGSVVERRSVE